MFVAVAQLVNVREQALSGYSGTRPWEQCRSAAIQDVEALWERTFNQRNLKDFGPAVRSAMQNARWDYRDTSTWVLPVQGVPE